jgi:hypothetical protein
LRLLRKIARPRTSTVSASGVYLPALLRILDSRQTSREVREVAMNEMSQPSNRLYGCPLIR